jgi:hypothetical protein
MMSWRPSTIGGCGRRRAAGSLLTRRPGDVAVVVVSMEGAVALEAKGILSSSTLLHVRAEVSHWQVDVNACDL